MPGGRPPKPTEIHELEGTYRADRHSVAAVSGNLLSEPPKPPKSLSKKAKIEWVTVTSWMCERKILASTDLSLIAMYCNEVATYFQCQKIIRDKGYTLEIRNKDGFIVKAIVRPEVARQKEAAKLALQYATQFGYTPSARVKLNLGTVKIASKLQELKKNMPKPKDKVIEI